MKRAVELALENVRSGAGGPFGAVVVKQGELIATGVNQVTVSNDPSAHAEVVAIRSACQALGTYQLNGCELYSSCEPCPMCLGAIYWARPDGYYFSCNRHDAATAGFDDAFIYDEIPLAPERRTIVGRPLLSEIGHLPFDEWIRALNKTSY
jgi:tRNA(Arg) A34 adenosine deaminase TadA